MSPNEKLKSVRKELGMSQSEFADKFHIKQSYYSSIERGTSDITNDIVTKLITFFRVNPDWYYFDKPPIFQPSRLKLKGIFAGSAFSNEIVLPVDDTKDSENPMISEFVEDMVKEARASKEFKLTKTLAHKATLEYTDDFKALYTSLENYLSLSMRLLQFLSQYDRYFSTSLHFEMYAKAKELNGDTSTLADYFKTLFSNVNRVKPVIDTINKQYERTLADLQQFDIDGLLNKDYWRKAREYAQNGYDYENMDQVDEVARLEAMFNLLQKKYPEF